MGKGLGSSETASQQIPEWLEEAAKRNLNQADRISRIGYVPQSYGPTVAAFSPMQNASFANTANMANAFGLEAPTGADVYGGMPAPTDYGNGVLAYSAKPIYDSMIGEFRADRPAQASYIDSFFIDPTTGTPGTFAGNVSDIGFTDNPVVAAPVVSGGGSDPYHGGDGVADFLDPNNRMGMAEHMARQKKNYAAGNSEGAIGYAEAPDGGVYAVGYEPGQMSPEVAAMTPGYSMMDKNPFDMSVGEHFGQIRSDVSNMKDQVVDDVSSVAKGDGTVMCSAYCKMGYLPKEIWKLDRRYGVKVLREDPALIEGYHLWGIPTANYIQKNTFFAKSVRFLMWPIVKAWAEEMAHCMKPKQYKPNYFGKAIKFVGEPFSRLCGSIYKYNVRVKEV